MMENDEQDVVSMVDVLQQDNELEEEAAAVLGDSDDKCCTYPMGYVSRQALYACLTCRGNRDSLAGICLACSYECHEGHEFVELYTKRDFRCDCGNTKFPNLTCKLIKIKQAVNSENQYNHNFTGVYCTCNRPYPDPEDSNEDEMIQCVLCEDWYHGRHIGCSSVPDSDGYQEMVCETCMDKCDFLWNYTLHSVETKVVKEETSSNIDVTSTDENKPNSSKSQENPSANGSSHSVDTKDAASTSCDSVTVNNEAQSEGNTGIDSQTSGLASSDSVSSAVMGTVSKESSSTSAIATVAGSDGVSSSTDSSKMSGAGDANKTDTCPESSVASSSHGSNTVKVESSATISVTLSATKKDEASTSEAASSSSNATTLLTPDDKRVSLAPAQGSAEEDLTAGDCRLKQLSNRTVERKKGSVFWPIGWRTKLCTCTECKAMYDRLKVSFLQDPNDSVAAYEERGKGKRKRSQYDQGMEALSNMDRVQQGEMMHGYHDMKSALSDFLRSFAEQGKVVTASDIQEFYESLTRKRQRVGSAGSMQYMCR
ncbi:putative E3 ubiquitin-protein ligase UBR7 [Strongylocentrotus purpuratus]|uniref:Putative E3 ubiquitin-protein ligase UBR7 n=1 Tax=Strongylocentrotus purpuratus TaxID=7668 RepID=A0A7M7HIR2_STRPU|nr:putative E3 ubiquitin-protein ligase UBR7 [Strongylocentrotus purpuratus]